MPGHIYRPFRESKDELRIGFIAFFVVNLVVLGLILLILATASALFDKSPISRLRAGP